MSLTRTVRLGVMAMCLFVAVAAAPWMGEVLCQAKKTMNDTLPLSLQLDQLGAMLSELRTQAGRWQRVESQLLTEAAVLKRDLTRLEAAQTTSELIDEDCETQNSVLSVQRAMLARVTDSGRIAHKRVQALTIGASTLALELRSLRLRARIADTACTVDGVKSRDHVLQDARELSDRLQCSLAEREQRWCDSLVDE